MVYDLVILGGGPAGAAAAVYAARKRLRTVLLAEEIGGQSIVSPRIENWIGIASLSGAEMAERLEAHMREYADDVLDLRIGTRGEKLLYEDGTHIFRVDTNSGETVAARAVLIATGSHRRKLEIPGAAQFDGKGVVYCASCDAPLFSGKAVAVIGGGNAGLETAQQLLAYASAITLFESGPMFRGDPVTRERLFRDARITPVTNAEIIEVKGEKFVTGLAYKDRRNGTLQEFSLEGVFVEIGSIPNSDFAASLVSRNKKGEIVIDHRTCRTSVEGIWAAGDVTDQPYKQNNISMGDAVKALEDVYLWLQKKPA